MVSFLIVGGLILIIAAFFVFDYYLIGKGYNLGYFLLSVITFSIFIFCIITSIDEIKNSKDLAVNGKETWATVIDGDVVTKHQRRRVKTNYINTLLYDGKQNKFTLDRIYKKGTMIKLVYSQKNPSNAIIMEKQKNFLNYYLYDKSFLDFLFPIFNLLSFILFGYLFFKKKN